MRTIVSCVRDALASFILAQSHLINLLVQARKHLPKERYEALAQEVTSELNSLLDSLNELEEEI